MWRLGRAKLPLSRVFPVRVILEVAARQEPRPPERGVRPKSYSCQSTSAPFEHRSGLLWTSEPNALASGGLLETVTV